MHEQLMKRFEESWAVPPPDIDRLDETSRPPAGHFTCRLYANFNLFWASEMCSVLRSRMAETDANVGETAASLADVLERFAMRLDKWRVDDSAGLLRETARWLRDDSPSADQAIKAVDALILYLNRVQNWVDRSIPWFDLDERIAPLPVAESP
jgi:hypothetical protein